GGYNGTQVPSSLSDTWTFVGGAWTAMGSSPSPSGRSVALLAPTLSMALVLYGGGDANGSLGDTWLFQAGSWSRLAPPVSPGVRAAYGLSFDPEIGEPVLFGGFTSGSWIADVWGFDAPIVGFTASRTTATAPTVIYFLADATGGVAPYSYLWSFADTSSPAPGNPMSHRFDTDGRFNVSLTATDTKGASALANLTISLTGFQAALSSTASAGDPLSLMFVGAATNGTAPYEYKWTFGDGSAGTGPVVTHNYSRAGSYDVLLNASDALGSTALTGSVVQLIVPPLNVSALAGARSGAVPLTVAFSAEASGGLPPYAYLWSFGNGASSNRANATQTYSAPGSYLVTLIVQDRAEQSSNWTGRVNVTAASPSTSGWTDTEFALLGAGAVAALGVAFGVRYIRRPRDPSRPQ
ncbi:MAG: PKD domain-containing protein, partial [Thermoplasmata archaeon]|nr:PKD domain-containing protein [Thermoplasmata archaeon]